MQRITTTLTTLCVIAAVSTASAGQSERRVHVESGGWRLAGTFAAGGTTPAPAVLLLNGAARDRRAYMPLARELASRGIASLRLDLRGEGESTNLGRFEPGRTNDLLEGADADVAAALAWLRAQPDVDGARVGVLGASYSGEAMAAAARAGARAGAYVALSPGSFSDESARAIDPSRTPWWFIASRDERFAQSVVAGIPAMSRTARVTIVSGNAHASDILSPHHILNAEIADWFAANLRGLTAPRLWGELPHGAYPVGFRTIEANDERGAIRIDLWYPAAADGPRMRFADYLRASGDLRGAAPGFPDSDESLAPTLARMVAGDAAAVSPAALADILASPMAAGRDRDGASGRFPLVLWTPRYGTTVMQATLSEFLASHGLVIAFARRENERARLPFELEGREAKAAELAARVDDMRAALAALARAPGVDLTRIGVLAWSYTGEMATALQQTEPRVTLVAGLSTTLVNDWVFDDPAALDALDPARLAAAYAVFTQPRESPPVLLARLPSAYYVELPGTAHGSFNALEGHLPSLLGLTPVQRWSVSSEAAARAYEATATMLLRLLRHHVVTPGARLLRRVELAAGLEDRLATAGR